MCLNTEDDFLCKVFCVSCQSLHDPVSKFPPLLVGGDWRCCVSWILYTYIRRSLYKIQCNEVVGMPNCWKCWQSNFPGLWVTQSHTTAICCSVWREGLHPRDLAIASELVVLNCVISRWTIDWLCNKTFELFASHFLRFGKMSFIMRMHYSIVNCSMAQWHYSGKTSDNC